MAESFHRVNPEFFFFQNDQPDGQEKVNILALFYSDFFFPSVFQYRAPALYIRNRRQVLISL
jgi:hypothetical protein